MRRFARTLRTILIVMICAFASSFFVQLVFPLRLRVGMPWREAKRKLALVIHSPVASGVGIAVRLNEQTGHPDRHADLRHIRLPDGRVIEILVEAPYEVDISPDEADWSIARFEVGPRFAGYGDKLRWLALPKTHPEVVNMSWCSWPAVIAFVVGAGVSGVLLPRLLRRWERQADKN